MTTRRQLLIALGAGSAGLPLTSYAQQPRKVWRIGYLGGGSLPASLESGVYGGFLQGMRDLGYVEGRDLLVEPRFAYGDYRRLPDLAAELVRLKVDVIVTASTPSTLAAQKATTTIPIVMTSSADPVRHGLVASLARPGGNITGLTNILSDIAPKQLDLMLATVPNLSRVAVLANPNNPISSGVRKSTQASAQRAGVTLLQIEARSPEQSRKRSQ